MITEAPSEVSRRFQSYLTQLRRSPSRFEESYPDSLEAYVFLYHSYLQDEAIWQALVRANEAIGNSDFLYAPKEYLEGEPHPDLLVSNSSWPELRERIIVGLEFYLASPDLRWPVWAYHEPCLHIGGPTRFVDAFRSEYGAWRDNESPWYEYPGIPTCDVCGTWWHPGWGDWRTRPWMCPPCASRRPEHRRAV